MDEIEMNAPAYAGDLSPSDAWKLLTDDRAATLIDVRTPAEWNYVGVPDLSSVGKQPLLVPWVFFPSMQLNEQFVTHVENSGLGRDAPLLFICRSGARSRAAAIAMTARGFTKCYNVAGGFEGDADKTRHRGTVSGWKVEGLPWVQG
jgi:rhodanese-related sulfurtransferase